MSHFMSKISKYPSGQSSQGWFIISYYFIWQVNLQRKSATALYLSVIVFAVIFHSIVIRWKCLATFHAQWFCLEA